jgi:putative phosphoribosyl transferase
MAMPFSDRRDAGRHLAGELTRFRTLEPIILALPRGGVPVAYEVASRLQAPLDVLLVRKLSVPGHSEVAMGAIASGGATVVNDEAVRFFHVSEPELDAELQRQRVELERRATLYRENAPALELRGRNLIVVDDGLATGSTMQAAVQALRQYGPSTVVSAAPVAAPAAYQALCAVADEVICVETPARFHAVGLWYRDFEQTSDQEVIDLLARARRHQRSEEGASAGMNVG